MSTAIDRPTQFSLLHEVASGPMSVQFVAVRQAPQRAGLVCVKVLRRRLHRDGEHLIRLRDHGRNLARLHHRHITPVQDVVRVGDHLALVSEYVDGVDLLDWVEVLRETGVLVPGRVVCEIVRATAVALDAALHRTPWGKRGPLGLSHRDLKPSNLMVDRDGEVKVLDFGTGYTSLAGRTARAGALQKGLIKYVSPDRRDGKRGGPPADIYALGIVGLELLRGRWLRRLRSSNPAHDRHLAEVVAVMGDLGTRTTADDTALRNILLRMVAYDPEARPSASEVAHTFRTLADRAPGPSLESFAHMHALPWLEPVPEEPDPEISDTEVHLVGEASELPDNQEWDAVSDSPLRTLPKTQEARWEETEHGWEQAGFSLRDDPYDDEDTTVRTSLEEIAESVISEPTQPAPEPAPPQDEGVDTDWELIPTTSSAVDEADEPTVVQVSAEPSIPSVTAPGAPKRGARRVVVPVAAGAALLALIVGLLAAGAVIGWLALG